MSLGLVILVTNTSNVSPPGRTSGGGVTTSDLEREELSDDTDDGRSMFSEALFSIGCRSSCKMGETISFALTNCAATKMFK